MNQHETLQDAIRADCVMSGDPIPGSRIVIEGKSFASQGRDMVAEAVRDGRLTAEQGASAYYLYFEQGNGDLFAAAAIRAIPGYMLGTRVPKADWHWK